MIIGAPKEKQNYICIDGYNTLLKQKIEQQGFTPSYFASGVFFYLKTNDLVNFMRKEEVPFE